MRHKKVKNLDKRIEASRRFLVEEPDQCKGKWRQLFGNDGELDGIYLNFSDPWPKARHAKRRFTFGDTLLKYKQILKEGGFVAFKTDNDDLFDFTLEEIERLGLEIKELSRDLHNSDYSAKEFTTEYEDKFRGLGKNINYVMI